MTDDEDDELELEDLEEFDLAVEESFREMLEYNRLARLYRERGHKTRRLTTLTRPTAKVTCSLELPCKWCGGEPGTFEIDNFDYWRAEDFLLGVKLGVIVCADHWGVMYERGHAPCLHPSEYLSPYEEVSGE